LIPLGSRCGCGCPDPPLSRAGALTQHLHSSLACGERYEKIHRP